MVSDVLGRRAFILNRILPIPLVHEVQAPIWASKTEFDRDVTPGTINVFREMVSQVNEFENKIRNWLPSARAGSREGLGHVLEACRAYLQIIAYEETDSVLCRKIDPADLVQQTFLEALRDFSKFQGEPDALLRWMRRLLLNNLANLRRDFSRDKRSVKREISLSDSDSSSYWAIQLCANASSPSFHAMKVERKDALEQAVARLPPDYQTVIHLRYQELFSIEAIAETMHRSENAIRKLCVRAMELLKREVDPTSYEAPMERTTTRK